MNGLSMKTQKFLFILLVLIPTYSFAYTQPSEICNKVSELKWDKLNSKLVGNALGVCWSLYKKTSNLEYAFAYARALEKDGHSAKTAANIYKQLAELGHARSAYNYALMIDQGQGVKKNKREAAMYFVISAKSGYAPAQNTIGWLHEDGDRLEKSLSSAKYWYQKAANQGHPKAQKALARISANETPAVPSHAQGFKDSTCSDWKAKSGYYFSDEFSLAKGNSYCVDYYSHSSNLDVATVKVLSGRGNPQLYIFDYNTGKLVHKGVTSGGEVIPFNGPTDSGKWYRILVKNDLNQDVTARFITHHVSYSSALEGALMGLGQTIIENLAAEFFGFDTNDRDYFSSVNNVGRLFNVVTNRLQGTNLSALNVSMLSNELGVALQKAGADRTVTNIITNAMSEYFGDIYKHY